MESQDGRQSVASIGDNEIEGNLDSTTHENTASNNETSSSSTHVVVETKVDSSRREENISDEEGYYDTVEDQDTSANCQNQTSTTSFAGDDTSISAINKSPPFSSMVFSFPNDDGNINKQGVNDSVGDQDSSAICQNNMVSNSFAGNDTSISSVTNSDPSSCMVVQSCPPRHNNGIPQSSAGHCSVSGGFRREGRVIAKLPTGFTKASMVIQYQERCNCASHLAFRSSVHNGFSHDDPNPPSGFAPNFYLPDSDSTLTAAHSGRNCFMCEVTNFAGWPMNVKKAFSARLDAHQQIRFARSIDYQAEVLCFEMQSKNYLDAKLLKQREVISFSSKIEEHHHKMNILLNEGITAQLAMQSHLATFFSSRFTDNKNNHGISPNDLGQKYLNTAIVCHEHIQKLSGVAKSISNCNIAIRSLCEKRSQCLNDWNVMQKSYAQSQDRLRVSRNFFKCSSIHPNQPKALPTYSNVFSLNQNQRQLAIKNTIDYFRDEYGIEFTG